MKRMFSFHLTLLLSFLSACAPLPVAPQRTALQIQALQSREYEVRDTRIVMKALLNVLQDEGFITKNAVVDLGLITATQEIDLERSGYAWTRMILLGNDATWIKSSVIEASANVSEFGDETRVRLNFQKKILDNRGATVTVEQIDDPKFYQDFFSKVSKRIFIQREHL